MLFTSLWQSSLFPWNTTEMIRLRYYNKRLPALMNHEYNCSVNWSGLYMVYQNYWRAITVFAKHNLYLLQYKCFCTINACPVVTTRGWLTLGYGQWHTQIKLFFLYSYKRSEVENHFKDREMWQTPEVTHSLMKPPHYANLSPLIWSYRWRSDWVRPVLPPSGLAVRRLILSHDGQPSRVR